MSDGLSPSDQALADAAFRASEDELLVALGEALAGGEARDLQPRDLRARAEAASPQSRTAPHGDLRSSRSAGVGGFGHGRCRHRRSARG